MGRRKTLCTVQYHIFTGRVKKYINNNELDLSTLWDEISRLKTKFEYITISSDYHEVKVGDDTVLIEKADLYLND